MSIIIDLIMIALLIGVIMHSIHLSQSLKNFQILHKEIKPLLKEHVASISNGAKQADQLRILIKEVSQAVQTKTPQVQLLKQDLEFMTNRANQVADYLEKLLQDARVMGIANQYLNRKTDNQENASPPLQETNTHPKVTHEKKVKTTVQATIIKRLRQKIVQPKPNITVQKQASKNIEPFFKSTLTQKLADKIREKNNAA